ncbi:hypothetical protein ACJRO7_026693 [Eucalyptus globulus]|uniref:TIR domain-containing protein n=1 Tax=Eucalyptus globulus TaxID=34317 RepID=A0ABD3JP53_EUCGL
MEKGQSPREKKRRIAEKEITDGASASSSLPSIPTGGGSDQYDVFLSFRGSDTRKEFTDHLYCSLINGGTVPISVFRDDNSLEIGKDFNSEILDAITRSKISIPIISENYASSKWCLRELVRIMDCQKSMSHTVLPIFYKVLPSDVRYLNGNFGEAFHSRKRRFDKEDIQEGQRALTEVSNLNGWESEKFANGREGELVEEVVKTILSKLRRDFQLDIPDHLVGVDDHVNKIRNWVDIPAKHARMIAICGMGGIGKTTLAKVIYNQLSNKFEHRSFLPNIRETTHSKGILELQNLLIREILPHERGVCKVDDGISLIKSRFKGIKVLILLDDVDHRDQLYALAREPVFHQPKFEVDYKYELTELDVVHSSCLFKRHAFSMGHCPKDFEGISRDILSTMGGLPLAIKVIGSYLYGKTDGKVWQDVLKKLRNEPDRDVQRTLKISYDALEPGQKKIFLDIACFFVGKEIEDKYAIYMWKDCDFYPYQGIEELKLRCLIKIGDRGEFRMHDQLRDLGRSIFCQGQPPERCLKLWIEDEDLLRRGDPKMASVVQFCVEPNMSSSAINLHLPKLVVLELSLNKLTEDWSGWSSIMEAKGLKVLDLSHSKDLKGTPNFSAFTKLEILILRECRKLEKVCPSIGKVKSLGSLDLRDCYSITELPKEVGELQILKELLLDHTAIREIPSSISSLRMLKKLSALNCCLLVGIPSIGELTSLQHLDLGGCWSLRDIPNLENLSSLQHLNLSRCWSLEKLPDSIENLSSLEYLDLSDYSGWHFHRRHYRSSPLRLGVLTTLQGNIHREVDLSRSNFLREIPISIGNLQNLQYMDISYSAIEGFPSAIGRLEKLRRLIFKSHDGKRVGFKEKICEKFPSLFNIIRTFQSELPNSMQKDSLLNILRGSHNELRLMLGLSSGLTYIHVYYPIRRLPQLSCLKELEELHLYGCNELEYIPELPPSLLKLCVDSCSKLILPEFDEFRYLEELSIKRYNSIERMDLSKLNCLKGLDIEDCNNLVEIQGQGKLEFLETINICRCKSIERLILPKLQCLKRFHAGSCNNLVEIRGLDKAELLEALDIPNCESIERTPDLPSFVPLKKLEKIVLSGCRSIKRLILPELVCLKQLKVNYCRNLVDIRGLDKADLLEELDISYCESIERLPDLPCFATIKELNINGCSNLRDVESLERFLSCRSIYIEGCDSLEKLPNLSKFENLEHFTLQSCFGVTKIPGLEESGSLKHMTIIDCKAIETLPDLSGCKKLHALTVQFCEKLTQIRGLEKLELRCLEIYGCDSLETQPKSPEIDAACDCDPWDGDDGCIILR